MKIKTGISCTFAKCTSLHVSIRLDEIPRKSVTQNVSQNERKWKKVDHSENYRICAKLI